MNVEIGAEAVLFPEKEYINGIFVAVRTVAGLNGHLLKKKCIYSRVNVNTLASAGAPFRPTTVQVPNLALT
jgi:hypothetical protein